MISMNNVKIINLKIVRNYYNLYHRSLVGFNIYQVKTGSLIQEQKGVFRTNCLDCLDRTNYVQSRIALRVVKMFLERYSREEVNSLCKEGMLLDFPVN